MLIFVADKIQFFKNLNPDFFNYGSLPIYLLKGASQFIEFISSRPIANYAGMLYVGRYLSLFFDVVTIFIIYKIAKLLFKNEQVGLFASFIYAISFFPIQNAHFFTVDTLFTCLSTILIYELILFINHHSWKRFIAVCIIFGALMSTKITAIIFLPVILLAMAIRAMKQYANWMSVIKYSLIYSLFFIIISSLFLFLFMPYAYLDFSKFWTDISAQLIMGRNPYIFPYTLQFVSTIPYLHYYKEIFLWGLGPLVSILSIVGFINIFIDSLKRLVLRKRKFLIFNFPYVPQGKQFLINLPILNNKIKENVPLLFIVCYYLSYFLIIGASAVKFMRYMLPLYPFFAITAGIGWYKICSRSRTFFIFFSLCMIICASLWSFMFVNIYSKSNTRIQATEWILKNIPQGSILAVEYWDDYLPTYKSELYRFQELHLYDQPDDAVKWQRIEVQLQSSDYIIIASNRLYAPIQKLNDCSKYKVCFPIGSEYYQKLFHNQLSFKKVKEFSNYPSINIGRWNFNLKDDYAEESFTVYDHPKIMIFKKSK